MATTAAGDEHDDVADFGYNQQLDRSIGRFAGVVFFGGLAYHWFVQRHKTGVLESHRFQSESAAVPDTQPLSAP